VDEILDITLLVAAACERLGIPYFVGGSLASSLHGIPRATQDVDIVAAIEPRHVEPIIAALRERFYLDPDAVRSAVQEKRSFNVIHLGSYFKADVFVPKDDETSRLQMERRQRFALAGTPLREIVVASPEDVVAHKLYWYALGDEVSERQWLDVLNVLRVSGDTLDWEYLRRAAQLLGVPALLDRALLSVGIDGT
jgi:hypothetical protein